MGKTKNLNNFGPKGWAMLGYAGLLMCINGIIHTNGINVLLNIINGMKGWDVSTLLTINTITGILGVCSSFVTGRLIVKIGAKKIGGIYLIAGGLAIMWFGHLNSIAAFFLCMTVLWVFSDGYGQMVPFTLTTNWFPRKKGIALGWSTMGYPICSIMAVPLLTTLIGAFGFGKAFIVLGGVQVVIGILTFLLVHDYPEEVGAYPDNDKEGIEDLQKMMEERKNYKSPLTVKGLLKDKNMWAIAVMMGLLWMSTIGIVSQLVPRLMSVGYEQSAATRFLQLSSVVGLFGSYFYGWLDQKIGTRKSVLIYCWGYVIVFLLLIFGHSSGALIIACVLAGTGTGAICNLLPSYIGTVYGKNDFAVANGVVSPIASMIRCMNFAILALGLKINGTYTPSYFIFIAFCVIAFFIALRTTDVYQEKEKEAA